MNIICVDALQASKPRVDVKGHLHHFTPNGNGEATVGRSAIRLQSFRDSDAVRPKNRPGQAYNPSRPAACFHCIQQMAPRTFYMFCSLAFIDPRVGHTTGVLSLFISILCHSD